MDPTTVFERARATQYPDDLLPRDLDEETWVAVDPETDCRGVGPFEEAARTNLVYAVEAYREHPDPTVPFVSSGTVGAVEMRWLAEDDASLVDRLLSLLPI